MGDGSLDGGAVSDTLAKSLMVEKWGWWLPLASPQGVKVRQHPGPSLGSPWAPERKRISTLVSSTPNATPPRREEMQKKLPSNTSSSACPEGSLWPEGGWPAAQNIQLAKSPIGVLSDDKMNFSHET